MLLLLCVDIDNFLLLLLSYCFFSLLQNALLGGDDVVCVVSGVVVVGIAGT